MNSIELSHLLFRWLHVLSSGGARGFAVGLHRVMTGRAMFIHMGAMLRIIVANNVQQRIWPVAALRLRHNASLAVAVILFMVRVFLIIAENRGRNY